MKESACGKFILFGEHSILQGGCALSMPIKNLRLEVEVDPHAGERQLDCDSFALDDHSRAQFWKLIGEQFPAWINARVRIRSDLPMGAGLGSSAALCVALCRLSNPQLTESQLIEKALLCENYFHGKSSGTDPTTIATESVLEFKNIHDFQKVRAVRPLKDFVWVLTDSLIRRSTATSIDGTRELQQQNPSAWQDIILKLQRICEKGCAAFKQGDTLSLGQLMNLAHEALVELGVSNSQLEKLRATYIEGGALGCKLTGAGRGGFLVSLFDRESWRRLQSRDNAGGLGRFLELAFDF